MNIIVKISDIINSFLDRPIKTELKNKRELKRIREIQNIMDDNKCSWEEAANAYYYKMKWEGEE